MVRKLKISKGSYKIASFIMYDPPTSANRDLLKENMPGGRLPSDFTARALDVAERNHVLYEL